MTTFETIYVVCMALLCCYAAYLLVERMTRSLRDESRK